MALEFGHCPSSDMVHGPLGPGRGGRARTADVIRLMKVPQQRQVIDYALARRATLADLVRGRLSPADVCDAHPDLLRAARYYGEQGETGCPICRKDRLTRVTYAYGDELQHASGRARPARSLDGLAQRFAHVRIYVVEVCRSCGWNHLSVSFVIGTAATEIGSPGDPVAGGMPDAVPVTRQVARPEPATRRKGQARHRRTARQ